MTRPRSPSITISCHSPGRYRNKSKRSFSNFKNVTLRFSFRDFDWWLLFFVLMICGLGVLEIRSATTHHQVFPAPTLNALLDWGRVFAKMFGISFLGCQAALDKIHWVYIAALASLLMVLIFGQKYLGARRWIKECPKAQTSGRQSGSN